MNDDEIWALAEKPVTEFVDSMREMKLSVERLMEFYTRHTRSKEQGHPGDHHDEDEQQQSLSPLACAKLELAVVFAINACYWMYLAANGEDPRKNEISKDMERIRLFMNRAQEVEESLEEACSSAKRHKTLPNIT